MPPLMNFSKNWRYVLAPSRYNYKTLINISILKLTETAGEEVWEAILAIYLQVIMIEKMLRTRKNRQHMQEQRRI